MDDGAGMTSMERNATGQPGLGLVTTLIVLAVGAAVVAVGLADQLKPMLRYAAAGVSAAFAIAAIVAALSLQKRWRELLEIAESKPMAAPAPVLPRVAPTVAAPTNQSELEAEIERLRSIERELTSAKVDAEAAMMAKGEFLATMSHEIRTPLNGIIPLLDLVLSTKLAPDQKEYLTTAYQSSRQLLSIVDDILDFSKLEANKLELETTGINLKELVDGVSRLMARNAESKGLQYSATIDPNVRLAMRGDPTRLRQVLTNLVRTRSSSPNAARSRFRSTSAPRRAPIPNCCSRFATPASASPPKARRSCSRNSRRPTIRPRAPSAAPGSGCRSASASSI